MPRTDEETEWIRASQRGDQAAFEHLIKRHQRMLISLAHRMTGASGDAEDVAQEAFLQAFKNLGSFRGDSEFSSWLYRIGINCCLNWQKRSAQRQRVHEEWASQTADTGEHGGDGLAQAVPAALLKLPAKQRAAIVLTVYDGLSHAEAARALNCSETTVSWRVFAARRKLKRLLQSAAGEISHD